MRTLCLTIIATLVSTASAQAQADATPEQHLAGAFIYQQRCTLCHGPRGMGEGYLPIRVSDYPDTNLVSNPQVRKLGDIKEKIEWGGFRESHGSDYSPPWIYELSGSDVVNISAFVALLREDSEQAQRLLDMTSAAAQNAGERIYQTRCVMCHGATGNGDGRLAGIVKTPPPANLVVSSLGRDEVIRIIRDGGKAVGRSEQMPPWGAELGDQIVLSVTDYVFALRGAENGAD